MPVHSRVELTALTEEQFRKLDYLVMGQIFASHSELGRLCNEDVYQSDVTNRLLYNGVASVHSKVEVVISFKDFRKKYYLDLVVNDAVVYELKATENLNGDHQRQLLNYLFLLDGRYGKLVNLRPARVEYQTVNNVLSAEERLRFDVRSQRWNESDDRCALLRKAFVELLREWGPFLDTSLYVEAVTHFLGGDEFVNRKIPLSRDGIVLGVQTLPLVNEESAFRITAVKESVESFELHLRRFLKPTPLRKLQWINMTDHLVEFTTLFA